MGEDALQSGDAPAVEAAQSAAAAAMASEGPWSLSRRALWQLQHALVQWCGAGTRPPKRYQTDPTGLHDVGSIQCCLRLGGFQGT